MLILGLTFYRLLSVRVNLRDEKLGADRRLGKKLGS